MQPSERARLFQDNGSAQGRDNEWNASQHGVFHTQSLAHVNWVTGGWTLQGTQTHRVHQPRAPHSCYGALPQVARQDMGEQCGYLTLALHNVICPWTWKKGLKSIKNHSCTLKLKCTKYQFLSLSVYAETYKDMLNFLGTTNIRETGNINY